MQYDYRHADHSMTDWDPDQYHRFREYREAPFHHISERLSLRPDERLIDLGCGTGEHTVALLARAPEGMAIGLDSSPSMIERARILEEAQPFRMRSRLKFRLGDIRLWREAGAYTLVFSHAALHWVASHRAVLGAAFAALEAGGRLVVQMPRNYDAPSHRLLYEIAGQDSFCAHLSHLTHRQAPVARPVSYCALLKELSFKSIDVYEVVFHHRLAGASEVVEWMKGTGLRPFLNALPPDCRASFLDAYLERLGHEYGTVPFDFEFRRIFLWASRL